VAVGEYWVLGWSIGVKDAQGRQWTASAASFGDVSTAQRVAVRGGQAVGVRLAPPVTVRLTADAVGNRVNFRLHFFGPGGEACHEVKVDGVLPPKPWLTIRDSAGKLVERMEFNYGCTFFCSQLWRAPKELKGDYTVGVACDFGPIAVETPAAVAFRLAGEDPDAIAARVGAEAPDFTLKAVEDGAPLQLQAMRPRPTLICFFCGCELCAAVAKELARPREQKPEVVAIFSAPELCTPEGAKGFRAKTGFRGAILADPGGRVAAAWDSVECPRCWAVDGNGMIRCVNAATETPAKAIVEGAVKALFR
jgi:peroxiredoxin